MSGRSRSSRPSRRGSSRSYADSSDDDAGDDRRYSTSSRSARSGWLPTRSHTRPRGAEYRRGDREREPGEIKWAASTVEELLPQLNDADKTALLGAMTNCPTDDKTITAFKTMVAETGIKTATALNNGLSIMTLFKTSPYFDTAKMRRPKGRDDTGTDNNISTCWLSRDRADVQKIYMLLRAKRMFWLFKSTFSRVNVGGQTDLLHLLLPESISQRGADNVSSEASRRVASSLSTWNAEGNAGDLVTVLTEHTIKLISTIKKIALDINRFNGLPPQTLADLEKMANMHDSDAPWIRLIMQGSTNNKMGSATTSSSSGTASSPSTADSTSTMMLNMLDKLSSKLDVLGAPSSSSAPPTKKATYHADTMPGSEAKTPPPSGRSHSSAPPRRRKIRFGRRIPLDPPPPSPTLDIEADKEKDLDLLDDDDDNTRADRIEAMMTKASFRRLWDGKQSIRNEPDFVSDDTILLGLSRADLDIKFSFTGFATDNFLNAKTTTRMMNDQWKEIKNAGSARKRHSIVNNLATSDEPFDIATLRVISLGAFDTDFVIGSTNAREFVKALGLLITAKKKKAKEDAARKKEEASAKYKAAINDAFDEGGADSASDSDDSAADSEVEVVTPKESTEPKEKKKKGKARKKGTQMHPPKALPPPPPAITSSRSTTRSGAKRRSEVRTNPQTPRPKRRKGGQAQSTNSTSTTRSRSMLAAANAATLADKEDEKKTPPETKGAK